MNIEHDELDPTGWPTWSPPDEAGISHYQGPAPVPAGPLHGHTYIGPRIVPCKVMNVDGTGSPFLRVICVCGWQTDPLPGVLLADAAVLYGDHLKEVTDG